MYTSEFDKHENFREFYLELAQTYGAGGVVDVACGTGAVLLYLAQRGIEIDGTDLSGEMCLLAECCGFEVTDIYRGYKGDKEDLNDISTASKYRSNLIWILKRKE